MKFLKFVLCISFLSISTLIYGQDYTLTVKVVDQSDNSPLDGVTILLDPCKCGGITNTNGIFSKKLKKIAIVFKSIIWAIDQSQLIRI